MRTLCSCSQLFQSNTWCSVALHYISWFWDFGVCQLVKHSFIYLPVVLTIWLCLWSLFAYKSLLQSDFPWWVRMLLLVVACHAAHHYLRCLPLCVLYCRFTSVQCWWRQLYHASVTQVHIQHVYSNSQPDVRTLVALKQYVRLHPQQGNTLQFLGDGIFSDLSASTACSTCNYGVYPGSVRCSDHSMACLFACSLLTH